MAVGFGGCESPLGVGVRVGNEGSKACTDDNRVAANINKPAIAIEKKIEKRFDMAPTSEPHYWEWSAIDNGS